MICCDVPSKIYWMSHRIVVDSFVLIMEIMFMPDLLMEIMEIYVIV